MNSPEPVRILVMPGDGIGPEITSATRHVLEAADDLFGLGLTFEEAEIGFAALESTGTTFPDAVLERVRHSDAAILGPVSHNDYPTREQGGLNPSGELRKRLDLYANIRPARTYDGLPARCSGTASLTIVRENTEGFYADRSMYLGPGEFMPDPDMALAIRKITRKASLRIARTAFRIAAESRRKVTAVHKANVLRVSDGLFLDCTRQVAEENPGIAYEENLVDSMAALLVRNISQFDVVVTTNMYGDILSDLASEIVGGLGMAASINAGDEHCVAQAQHGSAPSIAGQDTANPSSLIGSAALLLDWLAQRRHRDDLATAARSLTRAVERSVAAPETRTRDLGGNCGTAAYTQAVIGHLTES